MTGNVYEVDPYVFYFLTEVVGVNSENIKKDGVSLKITLDAKTLWKWRNNPIETIGQIAAEDGAQNIENEAALNTHNVRAALGLPDGVGVLMQGKNCLVTVPNGAIAQMIENMTALEGRILIHRNTADNKRTDMLGPGGHHF